MFDYTEEYLVNDIGSYSKDDVIFLLKDISDISLEQENEEREIAIQSGVHYSEMLPVEYKPTEDYMNLYRASLDDYGVKIAEAVALVSEKIFKKNGYNMVLVSLARAGTPAAILIRRYLLEKYNFDIKHYTISIIRGKGIDENALKYIIHNHPDKELQFIDGWTGKGAITIQLEEAINSFNKKYNMELKNNLAVIADPAFCVSYYGTREDFLIPSACLNSTVSGLVSRTVHRDDIIKENEFHGAKYYKELLEEDVSIQFIEKITENFKKDTINLISQLDESFEDKSPSWIGMKDVDNIMEKFEMSNVHFVKPGIGETTRVLLRRIPWKVLLREDISEEDSDVRHIVQLAKEKGVKIERFPLKAYKCCGLILEMGG